jgi:HSP20 family protein
MANTAVIEKPQKSVGTKDAHRAALAIYESDNAYTLLIELPGADEKNIQVTVKDERLTVEAPLRCPVPPAAQQRYSEMRLGAYTRTVELSDLVDEETIEATFYSGILQITMQKSKNGKSKKIAVKAK